jgi:hypothetical protein
VIKLSERKIVYSSSIIVQSIDIASSVAYMLYYNVTVCRQLNGYIHALKQQNIDFNGHKVMMHSKKASNEFLTLLKQVSYM